MRKMRTRIDRLALCLFCVLSLNGSLVNAADWPTWRHDANRTATTTGELPDNLKLQWVRQLPPSRPAWPEDPRLHFDARYEPVVMGKTMFVASSRNDSVTAFDTETGDRKWRFYASGPVRFAPLCAEGRVYFGADDGFFYCLNADSGALVWKIQAAPSERKVIGNERLISVWPMRGGPVLLDGWIHFTVGVWPFEGNFHVSINTRSKSGADSSQPEYKVETLSGGLTPQGYLSASDTKMFIPCGRSVAGCFDRQTGEQVKVSYSTRGTTNYHVSTIGPWLFHGGVCYNVQTGKTMQTAAFAPVLANDRFFSGAKGLVRAYDLKNPQTVESKDRRGKKIKKTVLTELWKLQVKSFKDQAVQIDIRAGDRLYGHAGHSLFAVDLPKGKNPAKVAWTTTIKHSPLTMLAADDKLFVITDEDQIYVFGQGGGTPKIHVLKKPSSVVKKDTWTGKTAAILKQTGTKTGYCVVLGIVSGRLIEELVRQSELHIVAVDPDQKKVDALRRSLDANGHYGARVAVQHGDPLSLGLPPYLAQLIVSEDLEAAGFGRRGFVESVFHVLRPYGGMACLDLSDDEHQRLTGLVAANAKPGAKVKRAGGLSQLVRAGALPGAADWTHEYGDASNTLMSQDRLVKAPLGVLWFGGPAADGSLFYNRHFWGPSMAVIHGRMFIQGPGKLTAVDVYTGRLLWQIPLKERKEARSGRRGNNFEKIIAGFHFVAVDDAVYLVDRREIIRLDPETGKQVSVFPAPKESVAWGRIRIHDNLLIAAVFHDTKKYGKLPTQLVAIDRHSGKTLWTKKAEMSFPVVAIGGDKLFCFDGAMEDFYQDWKRRGKIPKAADNRFFQAIDLRTGKQLWKERTDIIATWLSYSAEHDVMVVANRKLVAGFRGKTGAELWKKYNEGKGFAGHPENLWDKVIVWKNQVLDQRGPGQAYDLETGSSIMRKHPITGESVPWSFTKSGHHCNYAIASPHLMTFRAASAGFCDIETGTTSRLEGFRSGCRNSLIPADGVLNAPNFAHGCSCGFSLFTSLALVHVPETEMWSYSALKLDKTKGAVRRVGVNFGAPGDRHDEHGTLWLDYPNRGGSSPAVTVKVAGKKLRWFHRHSALVKGDLPWVAASGVEGAESISITLGKPADKSTGYTVRLHFLDTGETSTGKRLFDVTLQGKTVLKDFNVSQTAGGTNRSVMREFEGVEIGDALTVGLSATAGQPVISGVEIIAEAK